MQKTFNIVDYTSSAYQRITETALTEPLACWTLFYRLAASGQRHIQLYRPRCAVPTAKMAEVRVIS